MIAVRADTHPHCRCLTPSTPNASSMRFRCGTTAQNHERSFGLSMSTRRAQINSDEILIFCLKSSLKINNTVNFWFTLSELITVEKFFIFGPCQGFSKRHYLVWFFFCFVSLKRKAKVFASSIGPDTHNSMPKKICRFQ